MLSPTQQMEQFNIAYVLAITANAGFNHAVPVVDNHSVDLAISAEFPTEKGKRSDPEIKLQLKSKRDLHIKNGLVSYKLKKKNYDDLTKNCANPRYLIVCDLPKKTTQWLSHEKKFMTLKRHCYWVSLTGFPSTTNRSSVTITFPENQRFTTDVLIKMIEYARVGATL